MSGSCELFEGVREEDDLGLGPQLVEELAGAGERDEAADDLGDQRHRQVVRCQQVEAVSHQRVVVGFVARRAAQPVDPGAFGDGDPDLRHEYPLDIEGHHGLARIGAGRHGVIVAVRRVRCEKRTRSQP